MNLVEDFLANTDLSEQAPELSDFRPGGTVLLSSRRNASRHATALLLDSNGKLRVVAKIVRRPRQPRFLATEFEILRRLAARQRNEPIAPLPLVLGQHREHWLLLQTALEGKFLDRHKLARSPGRAWERVEQWLLNLATPAATVDDVWHAEQFVEPIRRLEQELEPTADERQLFADTEALTRELTTEHVPAPIEHGDLFRGHLAVTPNGSLAAIDWELGRLEGLAGADAVILLIDLFRGPSGDATAAAFAEHFLQPHGVARRWLGDHLERQGVERRLVDLIVLATLSRRALHIWEPIVSDHAPAQRNHGRHLFRKFWAVRLWRMTLERMNGR